MSFKKGDVVVTKELFYGVIIRTNGDKKHPIVAEFLNSDGETYEYNYTQSGYYFSAEEPDDWDIRLASKLEKALK